MQQAGDQLVCSVAHDSVCPSYRFADVGCGAVLDARAGDGVRFNEHIEHDGPVVFEHACRMGLEGIVSKRKGSWYHSGRSRDW